MLKEDELTVTIPWTSQSNTWWNETCAIVVEKFGLPGSKYVTRMSEDFMTFVFHDYRDATMCRILISERI